MATHPSIPVETLSDEEFGELARSILARELGPEGLVRYQKLIGDFDYTRDRHHWLNEVSVDQAIAEIENRRETTS